jgi:hypothetical protein
LITDARRAVELLVGLPDVEFLGLQERDDGVVAVHVQQAGESPGVPGLRELADREGSPLEVLVDLPVFAGRPACVDVRFGSAALTAIVRY